MKYLLLSLGLVSAVFSIPASSQSTLMATAFQPFVMPQSRARKISLALDNWTLKSGERPKAVRIARDCLSANGFIMQRGNGPNGIDQSAMPGMAFWSSINGAAILRATQNGGLEPQSDEDTAYKRNFASDEYDAAMRNDRLPQFIRDHYDECELIRKRFGG